ncbi:MAG: betaine--homocysteine S-methyltransferase [Pseudomonadota bacterium]
MNDTQTDALTALLKTRDWLLLDGATGTNLFNMGLASGDAPELWNIVAPEKIRALHDGFIGAGSDLILTNSFGGSRYRLKLHDAQDRVGEINRAAAGIARAAVEAAGRPVIVAGSVGPTGELLEPVGSLPVSEAVDAFREQIRALMDGGADVIWAETISSEEELRAVSEAADAEGAPYCVTLSFDTAGRTMMGITSQRFAALVEDLPARPVAVGANCGVGASDLLRTVLGLTAAAPAIPVIAKGNAGIPKFVDGHIHYDGTPDLMADYARLARDAGARLIGGCCGTGSEHLQAMRQALEAHQPGARPPLDEIAARTGAFSSQSDGTGEQTSGRRRRRRA